MDPAEFSQETWFLPVLYGFSSIVGILSCFFGFRLFRLILTVIVALAVGGLGAYIGFLAGNNPVWWSIGGFFVGLILGIIFGMFFYALAVATTGATATALFLLPLLENFELPWQLGITGIVAGVAALISVFLTNLIIQLATSFIGAFLASYSIAYFITGEALYQVVQESETMTVQVDASLMVNIIATVVALIGFLFQRSRASD